MREQPEPLELGQLRPHGRGRDRHPGPLDERLRPDRDARRDVLLDDPREDLLLPVGQLHARALMACDAMVSRCTQLSGEKRQARSAAVTPSPRNRPRGGERDGAVGRRREPEPLEPLEPVEVEHRPRPAAPRPARRGAARASPARPRAPRPAAPRARAAAGYPPASAVDVAAERRQVPPAPILDCADSAHAEAEVVVPEPVAEVVPRAEVARPARRGEVRRLVPAVAGCRSASRRPARSRTPSTRPAAPARLRGRA